MRWALLDPDGVVVNVIVWDSGAPYTTTLEMVELEPGSPIGPGWRRWSGEWVPVGWLFVEGAWVAPPVEEVPE